MKEYCVSIDGKQRELNKVRVSAYPFNRTWPGKQRDLSQSEIAYTVYEYGKGEKSVEVTCNEPIKSITIRPLSKAVECIVSENKASFTIKEYGKYSVEINDIHNTINMFYRPEKVFEYAKSATYCFESGEHNIGLMRLKSGDSVYIGKDAVLNASILAVDCENVKIFGYGILNGKLENRTEKHGDIGWDDENVFEAEMIHTCGGIRMYRSKNITIDGITVTDPASYAVSFFACENITVRDVCVVGLWKYNTDGIDFFNSKDITVEDCFIRSFDDSMCFKGITAFSDRNTENIHISSCVFWCDWGKNLDIGLATAARNIKDITVNNCDIISSNWTCIAISNGQWADIQNIVFKDIRIEYRDKYYKPVIQGTDDQVYTEECGTDYLPTFIAITDMRRNWQENVSYPDPRAKIHNILFKDISVFSNTSEIPPILIKKTTEESTMENINFENVRFNGELFNI